MIKQLEKSLKQTAEQLLLTFCFKSKQIKQAYNSNYKSECEDRVLFLKITDGEK